jgi:hypothetical protein
MATTTNYAWTTPDDTALVKDGAAAIRSLGTSIDTTVFNNASGAIAKTIVDAKGDIIAATAADTVSRLAVGANDTVLTADSTAATGLKWATPAAGGMTSIATGSLSGASTSITSIAGTYKNLQLIISAPTATSNFNLRIQFNTDTGSNYRHSLISNNSASIVSSTGTSATITPDTLLSTGAVYGFALVIDDYASSSHWKHFVFNGNGNTNTPTAFVVLGTGGWASTSAITSIQILASAGTFNGGTYTLYGVK